MEIDLVKEDQDDGAIGSEGYLTPTFCFAQDSMSTTDPKDDFTISLGGDNCLWFSFGKGKRRVKTHLGKILMEAYRIAMEV
jgi:hypothetical protein